ncbi:MAG: hypothetical protein ACRDH2_09635, partial [Anaerolineales bacterium]
MKHLRILLKLCLPLSLAVLLLALGRAALTAYAAGAISGTVTSPNGYPLPAGTLVKLLEPGAGEVRGQASPDLSAGAFSFAGVPNGLYLLRASPPAGSGLTPSLPVPVSVLGGPVSGVNLALTTPQITGAVTTPDGVTPITATVTVFGGNGLPVEHVAAPGGQFAVGGLPNGSYALKAFRATDDPYFDSEPYNITVSGSTQVVTLTLTHAQLYGVVQDELGLPVKDATVVAARSNAGDHARTHTGPSGYWTLGGLSDGTYALAAFPPPDRPGLLPSAPISATLPGASNPYSITLPFADKTVTGTVQTNTGTPVFHAQVRARRLNAFGHAEALTGADGTYTLDLSPGLWALTVHAISDTNPADWVYPHPPKLVHFLPTPSAETKRVNFTVLTADATVTGIVELPGGSTPPFTVTVGLFSDEGVGKRTTIDPLDGSFSLNVPHGGYKVVIHPEDPNYLGPDVPPFRVEANGTYDLGTLTLLALDAAITGAVTDEDGSGVAGIPVLAWRPGIPGGLHTHTGPDGMYLLSVSAGVWHVRPAPTPDQPYLYLDAGEVVSVAAGSTIPNVDFSLTNAGAAIE